MIRTEMENAWKLTVPLVVETGAGRKLGGGALDGTRTKAEVRMQIPEVRTAELAPHLAFSSLH